MMLCIELHLSGSSLPTHMVGKAGSLVAKKTGSRELLSLVSFIVTWPVSDRARVPAWVFWFHVPWLSH